jgi:hypothetical protein
MGAIHRLPAPDVGISKIMLHTPGGKIDPATHGIVTGDPGFHKNVPFDFVIQGPGSVHKGELFIVSIRQSVGRGKALRKDFRLRLSRYPPTPR